MKIRIFFLKWKNIILILDGLPVKEIHLLQLPNKKSWMTSCTWIIWDLMLFAG